MKRITLLMIAFLGSIALQAQTPILDQPGDMGTGVFSEHFNLGTPAGIYMADDIVVSNSATLNSVKFYGFQSSGTLETLLTGFNLYIYTDAAGVPSSNPSVSGGALLEIALPAGDPALTVEIVDNGDEAAFTYNFTVDIVASEGAGLALTAGTYWIVAAPQVDLDPAVAIPAQIDVWYWLFSASMNGNESMLIDPSDQLGGGLDSWTATSAALGDPTFNSLGMTLYGENMAIASNLLPQISLYPNPMQDQLNINLPNSIELESATMFDLLGQQTVMSIGENNTLNTSNLASGVYILKLETNQGTMTKKVIKQ